MISCTSIIIFAYFMQKNNVRNQGDETMIRILFVCHGNICRSPMAKFVMKRLVQNAGVSDTYEIASAATSSEEIGNPVYPPVRRLLAQKGVDTAGKTARRLHASDYDAYDYLIGMDSANYRNMLRLFDNDPDDKVTLLLQHAGEMRDVSDPWYTGDFEQTWHDVSRGCRALLDEIQSK